MRKALLNKVILPASSMLTPFKSWQIMKKMCALDTEPLERQRMDRMAILRDLLIHAYRETDLYRTKLDNKGIEPIQVSYPNVFMQVPITSKVDLREGFPGRQLARSFRKKWLRYSNTSGSTGRPLLLIQDINDISAKYASILWSRQLVGVDSMGVQVRITPNECQPFAPDGDESGWSATASTNGSPAGRPSGWFRFLERQVINPWFHRRHMLTPFWEGNSPMTPVDLDDYLDQVDGFKPEILSLYPLYALILARHLERTGRTPPPIGGILEFSGGVCSPRMHDYIGRQFNARTAQACGGCEFARFGASCLSDPTRMHLAENYCYVEAVRNDGTLCAPGELGNLLVTSLHSWAMPVIRLEPGDVGRLVEDRCECGRRSRRLEHGGRLQSLIRNADGRWVTGTEIWDELLFVPGIDLFELEQHSPSEYTLRIVAAFDTPLDKGALDEALRVLLGGEASVHQETVAHLRTQASGKLQLVKSVTFDNFRPGSPDHRPQVPIN